jgi:hypothetical protein
VVDGLFHQDPSGQLNFYRIFDLPDDAIKKAEEEIRKKILPLFQRQKILNKDETENMLSWPHSGFSLHADVRVHPEDREGLERLIRYCARPAFASEKLKWVRPGKLLSYTSPKPDPKGQITFLLDPMQLIDKLASLIPPPKRHRHHYYGVFAPASPLRKAVTDHAGKQIPQAIQKQEVAAVQRKTSLFFSLWAILIARIYGVFPLECPKCGGSMRIISFIIALGCHTSHPISPRRAHNTARGFSSKGSATN